MQALRDVKARLVSVAVMQPILGRMLACTAVTRRFLDMLEHHQNLLLLHMEHFRGAGTTRVLEERRQQLLNILQGTSGEVAFLADLGSTLASPIAEGR